jgi:hypothetical protein
MNRQILKYGLIPFLFGFLLLGAMDPPAAHHDAGAAARPAHVPRPTRALAQDADAATLAPLPVYVTEPDDAACTGIRVCNWST